MQHKLIKLYTPAIEELMHQYWQEQNPDLIVSFVPHFNDIMIRTLKQVHPRTPYVTVMTDLADCPPNFWLGRSDHFVICGSDMAVHQAQTAGYQPRKIFKTSGMILKPHFYRNDNVGDRREERKKLGLDPDLPTALIMFGGNGSREAIPIVRRLARRHPRVQCIVMCGRNEKLRRQLAKKKFCHAVGFTADKVSTYMELADFFIGKPGPGSISEALHMGLPVIVEYNRRTMPQERYNALWIQEQELGLTVKSFAFIASAVRNLLKDGRLETFRRNARRFNNRAVFEIPGMLASIMTEGFD
jgi:1,2-diacylglycerol 3-beta-galactosyltransferase